MVTQVQTDIPPETSDHARGSFHVSWIVWAVPTLLILYVLSIGPVVKFSHGHAPPEPIILMYKLIALLVEHTSVANKFLFWYLHDVWHCS
jgi:hypothetical protein